MLILVVDLVINDGEVFLLKRHAFKIPQVVVPMVFLVVVYFLYTLHMRGILLNQVKMEAYIKSYGLFAPVALIFIYILFTMFPVVPSTVATIVGIIVFGPFMGFIYNYLATVIGSIINFLISKKFGKNVVIKIVGEKRYDNYVLKYGNNPKFVYLFTFLIFIPFAPDDILCYFVGLTNMSYKKFITIIVTMKWFTPLLYSLGAFGYFAIVT